MAVKRCPVSLLVDTGAVELLRRGERRVESLVLRFFPPLLCPQVAGEFLFGQEHAGVSSARMLQVREFLASFEPITSTTATAVIYARLRADASARGLTLPDQTCGSRRTPSNSTAIWFQPTATSGISPKSACTTSRPRLPERISPPTTAFTFSAS